MGAQWADVLSNICGVIYSLSWNFSFYPQLFENYELKSVAGFSLEYALLNPSGYLFYTIYCATGFINPNLGTGQVDWQDLFFAAHGVALSTSHLVQCFIYSRGEKNKNFKPWLLVFLLSEYIVFIVFFSLEVSGHLMPSGGNIINICGYNKAAITLIKYTPQVILNYQRKSTVGWSIGNVILDFCGGLFSLLQLIIEAIGNGRPIIGDGAFNVIKFVLSILSIGYNIIFLTQHYVIYRHHPTKERSSLIKDDEDRKLFKDSKKYINPSFSRTTENESEQHPTDKEAQSTSMNLVIEKESSNTY